MDRLDILAAEIAAVGGKAVPVVLDVTDAGAVAPAFDRAEAADSVAHDSVVIERELPAAPVRDPIRSGGVIPGASLTVSNQASGGVHTAVAGADGSYAVVVGPGVYSVTAVLKGFGRQTRKDVRVEAGSSADRHSSSTS